MKSTPSVETTSLLSEVTLLQNSDCTFDTIHPPYWTTPISARGGIFYAYGEPALHADVPSLSGELVLHAEAVCWRADTLLCMRRYVYLLSMRRYLFETIIVQSLH